MAFNFKYGGHAESSKGGKRVDYSSHGSGDATYKSVERTLASSVSRASEGATQAAISSVTTTKIEINTDD